jgi:hypothetical protein
MKIAIEINGVLRDTIGKIEQTYRKFLMDDILLEESDFKREVTEPIDSLNLSNHFKFKDENEIYEFLYLEFAMQIFGHAGSSETFTFNDLNDFYIEFRDKYKIILISDEIGKSKPSTLFFLSKFGCLIEHITFYSKLTKDDVLSDVDILLTSNPELLLENNNVLKIKYVTKYNQDINCENTITKIKELKDIIEKL